MEMSNVIAAELPIFSQRGASFEYYFRAKDADGNFINWTTVPEIKMDIKDHFGNIITSFELNDGFSILPEDHSFLIFRKAANEKNIPAGTYRYDLKSGFSTQVVQYPVRGNYVSFDFITA